MYFSSEEQAIELANASRYGLNANVWTHDARRGVRVARLIRAGSVNINEAYATAWGSVDSAIGGRKDSGLRPRHGTEGFLKYTETQTVATQRLRPIGPRRGADVARYARWMTRLLKVLRRTRVMG